MFSTFQLIFSILQLLCINGGPNSSSGMNRLHAMNLDSMLVDMVYSQQWYLPAINATGAWKIITGDPKIIIAVLDSGVDSTHPDLDDGKVIGGYNFVNNSADTITDLYGHGTMIAGIAAAHTDKGGVVGVCPDCSIMSIVVADRKGNCNDSNLVDGIRYAAAHGARVINISYGSRLNNPILQNAINEVWNQGVVIIASAGNSPENSLSYPAAYDNVIAVSATDQHDKPARFTANGVWIDLFAPGVDIVTTGLGGHYASGSGTSFSAAIISGLAGLIYSANPDLTNAQVVDIIINRSDKMVNTGVDSGYRYARVNLYKATAEAMADVGSKTAKSLQPMHRSSS